MKKTLFVLIIIFSTILFNFNVQAVTSPYIINGNTNSPNLYEKVTMDYTSKLIEDAQKKMSNCNLGPVKKSEKVKKPKGYRIEDVLKDDGKKVAFLTFDDGPSKNVTPKILDILKQYNIKATFFIVGSMAKSYPQIVKRIHAEGHSIANHSYSHGYKYLYSNTQNFIGEIKQWENVLKDILGDEFQTKIFRFPGGSFGNNHLTLKATLKEYGYNFINWNALTGDSEGRNIPAASLIKRAKATISGKNHPVILMHDLGSKSTTVQALPEVIEYLIDQGYEFDVLAN